MIRFSQEKVLLLHQLIIQETGGSPELRYIDLLNSAIEGVYQTFGGQELYPTKEKKGARLGYTLISNHAFVDGNKRIGMYVILKRWHHEQHFNSKNQHCRSRHRCNRQRSQ